MSLRPDLVQFLDTDPLDVGCGRAMQVLHTYAEMIAAGLPAGVRYPGVAAHLAACGPCGEDFDTLLGLIGRP
jgi:hypothetical protein